MLLDRDDRLSLKEVRHWYTPTIRCSFNDIDRDASRFIGLVEFRHGQKGRERILLSINRIITTFATFRTQASVVKHTISTHNYDHLM